MKAVKSVLTGLLLALLQIASAADEGPPVNARQFHEQEAARIRRGLEAMQQQAITSTQADYDVTYYDLQVDARNYAAHQMSGGVNITARSVASDLNEMVLDFCATMTIDSVYAAGAPTTYTRSAAVLTVALDRVYTIGEMVTVRVVWHGTPCLTNDNPSYSFYDRPSGSGTVPSVSTLSEPYGARDWWPCKDVVGDKADSARIRVTVADTVTVTSNGLLESMVTVPPSSRRFTYFESYPIPTYLMCFAATNYAHFRQWYVTLDGDSMPIDNYPYPEYLSNAQVSWSNCPDMMQFMSETFGEYPFAREKYGMTNFQWSGGMEHQTNTFYGYQITNGTHSYDWIEIHELSHHWWGDRTTCATWADVWLNEGFASYMEALWFEHLNGPGALRNWQNSLGSNGVSDPSGPVYNPADLFNGNTVYNKGSWILHMLRGVIRNDSLFFAAMRHFGEQHNYANATTAQFFSDISSVVGYNVEPYLHAYVYRTNRPQFRISHGFNTLHGQNVNVVRIRQVQTNPDTTFRTRLDLHFYADNDEAWERVENSQRRERYYFNLSFPGVWLDVDPDSWVLKQAQNESLPLTILNSAVDSGTVGQPYADTLRAIYGTSMFVPGTWEILSGAMPQGLTLSSAGGNGVILGTPQQTGSYAFQVRVWNTTYGADTVWFNLLVGSPVPAPEQLTAYLLPDGRVRLNWNAVELADSYYVHRAVHADMLNAQHILTTTSTFAIDSTVQVAGPDTVVARFYQVTAVGTARRAAGISPVPPEPDVQSPMDKPR